MKEQTPTAIEIEALALSTLISPDERQKPVSLDGGDYLSKPETRGRAALRWLIDRLTRRRQFLEAPAPRTLSPRRIRSASPR